MDIPQGSDKEIRERIGRLIGQDVSVISENQMIQGNLRAIKNDVLTIDDYARVVIANGDKKIQPHRWYVRINALSGIGHRIANEIEVPAMPTRAPVDTHVATPPPEPMKYGWVLLSGEDQWHCIDLLSVIDEAETFCGKIAGKVLTMQKQCPLDGDVCPVCEKKAK